MLPFARDAHGKAREGIARRGKPGPQRSGSRLHNAIQHHPPSVETLALCDDAAFDPMAHPTNIVFDLPADLALCANHDLRGSRRCRRAQISYQIANGEVCFVTDAGNRWNRTVGDRARNDLLVERPQIFERSAPAANENDVMDLPSGKMTNRSRDLSRGSGALHAHLIDLQ